MKALPSGQIDLSFTDLKCVNGVTFLSFYMKKKGPRFSMVPLFDFDFFGVLFQMGLFSREGLWVESSNGSIRELCHDILNQCF